MNTETIMLLATLAIMAISAVTDIRKRTLPIALYPILLAIAFLLGLGVFSSRPWIYLMTGLLFGAVFLISAMFGGGGGDVILILVLSLIYGFFPMMIMVFVAALASLFWYGIAALIYGGTLQIKMKMPYAPFLLAGFMFYILT